MGLKIIIAVAAFIALLLIARLRLVLLNDGSEFTVKIKYLFLAVRINKRGKGKDKKEAKKIKAEPQEEPKGKPRVIELIKTVNRYSSLLKDLAGDVIARLRIDRLFIRLIINEDDAADTALVYGEACAVIYPAVAWLTGKITVKKHEIVIKPNFFGEAEAQFECVVSVRLFHLVAISIVKLTQYVVHTLNENKKYKKPAKDGAVK